MTTRHPRPDPRERSPHHVTASFRSWSVGLGLLVILGPGSLWGDLANLDLSVRGTDLAPAVTIRQEGNRVVEEFRVNNQLYMIKITPTVGAPYYLVDPDGSGDMAWNRGGPQLERQVPQWVLFRW